MAILWSTRQMAVCVWFVSLSGYDTVSAWNAYLLSQSLPQDCTAANLGSSTYPFRSWSAVVADARVLSGAKVAVGIGKWDNSCYRTVVTKSLYWLGMIGTVIDLQLLGGIPFRVTSAQETVDTIRFVNGEFRNVYSATFKMLNCDIDYIVINTTSYINAVDCLFRYVTGSSSSNTHTMTRCTVAAGNCPSISRIVSSIIRSSVAQGGAWSQSLYSIVPAGSSNLYKCIVADPLFNNEAIGDYTLRSNSPALYAGQHGVHMGAFGEAQTITPNSPELADGIAVYSTTGGLTDLVKVSYDVGGVTMYMLSLRTGKMSGTVETGWIDFGTSREVDSMSFVADMLYSEAGNYAQAPSPDLNKLTLSYKAALTEAEKAGVSWVSKEWGVGDLAISARYIKMLITITSTTPAP